MKRIGLIFLIWFLIEVIASFITTAFIFPFLSLNYGESLVFDFTLESNLLSLIVSAIISLPFLFVYIVKLGFSSYVLTIFFRKSTFFIISCIAISMLPFEALFYFKIPFVYIIIIFSVYSLTTIFVISILKIVFKKTSQIKRKPSIELSEGTF